MKQNKITYSSKQENDYEKFEDTIKYIPEDQLKIFLQFVRELEDKNRTRNKLIFELWISIGSRIGEFSLIKVSDVDFNSCTINLPQSNTKSSQRRTVRVKKEVLLDLKDYLISKNIKSGVIFRNKNNAPMSTRAFQKICDKYFMHPGLQQIENFNLSFKPSPHTFRHTHIILALQKGVPINAIMQNVGHMDLSTTQIYSKIAGIEIAKGYEGFTY